MVEHPIEESDYEGKERKGQNLDEEMGQRRVVFMFIYFAFFLITKIVNDL